MTWPGSAEGEAPAEGETPEAAPFWDPSASEDPADDPIDGYRWERVLDVPASEVPASEVPASEVPRSEVPRSEPGAADEADAPGTERAESADPPRPQWRAVVTPVEEAEGDRRPGLGLLRGNLAHLSANPRMRIWQLRAVVAVAILVAFSIVASWQLGLTLAVLAVIADTIFRARRSYASKTRLSGAQKQTRRQLNKLDRAGYRAIHARPIPESEDQIDHLVVGPAGVFAIDSEQWNKRLPVRTRNARQLYHGPYSKKDRLEHAQWEAQRAADLLSGETGKPVSVRPVMAVYGPRIPWDVVTIRDVDVFSGPRLRKYLRRRGRSGEVRPLTDEEIERIFTAASRAFPHFSSGSPAR